MTVYLDSSVLVAALVEDEPAHQACLGLLRRKNLVVWTHGIAETFATLTGGRLGIRVRPSTAAGLINASLLSRVRLLEIGATEMIEAIGGCESAGVRGGAIFDFLHLLAARNSSASTLYTLNNRHFIALAGRSDPRIDVPE
jgi:predicted nucleic acid-binding protein